MRTSVDAFGPLCAETCLQMQDRSKAKVTQSPPYMYVYMMYIYICMHACMYVCMYACVYACVYVCMACTFHVYTYIHMYVYLYSGPHDSSISALTCRPLTMNCVFGGTFKAPDFAVKRVVMHTNPHLPCKSTFCGIPETLDLSVCICICLNIVLCMSPSHTHSV